MNEQEKMTEIEEIFSPHTIRKRCSDVYKLALSGKTHFIIHEEKLEEVANIVKNITLKNYPSLNIPFHSRWNHFNVGNIDRLLELKNKCESLTLHEKTKSKIDLVIVSVLLDAGAGMRWRFRDEKKEYARSEGLAIASLRMFMAGLFSSDPNFPLRVDAHKLEKLSLHDLEIGFQVSENNALVGLEGRLKLLHNLGKAIQENTSFFGTKNPRIGNILEFFIEKASCQEGKIEAPQILRAIQDSLGSIWPGRTILNGINLGDVWNYKPLGEGISALIPFHKLSQWLSYSLFEPLMENGIGIASIQELTGLAEYRNGGLILDSGLVQLKDFSLKNEIHLVDSEIIVEWRALTISLLDKIALRVAELLDKKPNEFPLARVLEGGTWWAGRELAQKLRDDGGPPLKVQSDGTVF